MRSRWSINITPTERAARVALGSLSTWAGIVLLTGGISALAPTLGQCPLYARLAHVPASLKGRTP